SLAPDSSMPSRSEEDSRSEFCPRSPWANILIARRGCVSTDLQDVRPLTSSVRIAVRNVPARVRERICRSRDAHGPLTGLARRAPGEKISNYEHTSLFGLDARVSEPASQTGSRGPAAQMGRRVEPV